VLRLLQRHPARANLPMQPELIPVLHHATEWARDVQSSLPNFEKTSTSPPARRPTPKAARSPGSRWRCRTTAKASVGGSRSD